MHCPTLRELPSPPADKKGWPWDEPGILNPIKLSGLSDLPKVTIVTPSYNQAQFIEETIRSVLLQNYSDIEYIVIDGGSTDGSVDIIRKYAPWLSYWTSEPDRGQSHAVNKGWQRSNGDVISWLNSDDIYDASAIHNVVNFFRSNEDSDVVYGDCVIIDEKGNFEGNCPTMEFSLEALVCNKWFIAQPATFIRKEVKDSVGGLNEDLHLVMDWEFWLKIALNGFNITYLKETLASYRKYKNAKTEFLYCQSGEEKVRVLNHFFQNPLFYSNIIGYKNQAYSYVHRWVGNANYRGENFRTAAVHFFKALRYCPSLVRDRNFLRTAILALKRSVLP